MMNQLQTFQLNPSLNWVQMCSIELTWTGLSVLSTFFTVQCKTMALGTLTLYYFGWGGGVMWHPRTDHSTPPPPPPVAELCPWVVKAESWPYKSSAQNSGRPCRFDPCLMTRTRVIPLSDASTENGQRTSLGACQSTIWLDWQQQSTENREKVLHVNSWMEWSELKKSWQAN